MSQVSAAARAALESDGSARSLGRSSTDQLLRSGQTQRRAAQDSKAQGSDKELEDVSVDLPEGSQREKRSQLSSNTARNDEQPRGNLPNEHHEEEIPFRTF